MKRHLCRFLLACALLPAFGASAQSMENRFSNGLQDIRESPTALVNGVLVLQPGDQRSNQTLLFRNGRIERVIKGEIPEGYHKIDLKGAYVYPGLVDFYSNYGMPKVGKRSASRFSGPEVLASTASSATNANEAIKSHLRGSDLFRVDAKEAKKLRKLGFTSVLSFQPDGIAQGSSVAVLTQEGLANEIILSSQVATHYSFDKGSSKQFYPVSRMGVVSLLRQTHLDAEWYAAQSPKPFADLSLDGWLQADALPKVMSAFDWKTTLLADQIGDEFDNQFIIKGGGDEYKRLALIKRTSATMIVGVDFPRAPNVSDPLVTDRISLAQLKHWELAPYNLARLEQSKIPFVITSAGSGDDFWRHLRRAVKNGLSERAALNAITLAPAKLMSLEAEIGSLDNDRLANFVVSDGPLFEEGSRILSTWIKGEQYIVTPASELISGSYVLKVTDIQGDVSYPVTVSQQGDRYYLKADNDDGVSFKLNVEDDYLNLVIDRDTDVIQSSAWFVGNTWQGSGTDGIGTSVSVELTQTMLDKQDNFPTEEAAGDISDQPGAVIYPFIAHGSAQLPEQETILITNATVWTNEAEGVLEDTDVLVEDGKIAQIGSNLTAGDVRVIDGTSLHLTPGLIDEHSHIALDGVNEFVTNSSMVRMADVVDSEDIGIYRDLAGGVTAAQLLHGSANPIGGQSALIKMRWGAPPEKLLIEDADQFIKFALGENVKRSSNKQSIRYPQTRMGVEQFYINEFSEARQYEADWKAYNKLSKRKRKNVAQPRRDLRKETLVEILNADRFVTSHSYVQSEINMLMHVAEQFDFRINTFTHILEGYKVADKMAAHGVGGSTFSDWWAYKWEVRYAIPYNAALMHQAGVVTAINSDDAEMSRRLNQEAAKSIRHGGLTEEDALKLVTLNPAKLLHLDDRMGSIAQGKDADLVLWSGHPLSIYSKAETTLVDGIVYFDRKKDLALREEVKVERSRLIQKILAEGEGEDGKSFAPPDPGKLDYHHDEIEHMVEVLLEGAGEDNRTTLEGAAYE